MSVVQRSPAGWLLDPGALIDRGLSPCVRWRKPRGSEFECRFRRSCFRTGTAHTATVPKDDDPPVKPSRKRKRRQTVLNQGEIDSQAYHEKIRAFVLEGTKSLVEAGRSLGFLDEARDAVEGDLPLQECRLAALCHMAKELPVEASGDHERPVQALSAEDGDTSHLDLFSRVTENRADSAVEVSLMGDAYVIPPRSAFLLSDLTRIQPLVEYGKRFDLIVMDPPWENKSVKRSRRYSSLPSSQLRRLPVPLLASPGCLVVTWVTNRPSHRRFVLDELYPHWGVAVLAQWLWVKVTTSGEFVFPLDSPHKKPYEVLVLGRYRGAAEGQPGCGASAPGGPRPVEERRLIVSVPSAFHSHKPPLAEVLGPYLGAQPKCLELFARSLHPGWTCWGNEVLKFQHSGYFHATAAGDGAD